MLAAILYIMAVVAANLTASTLLTLPGFGLVAVGTLFFGATFTLRDRMHARGKAFVYRVIAVAAVVNVVVALLTDTPTRIVFASFLAIVLNESADTEVYERLKERSWFVRVLSSNAVSIPIDTVLFTLIAFGGVWSTEQVIAVIYGDILVKVAVSLLIALVYAPIVRRVYVSH